MQHWKKLLGLKFENSANGTDMPEPWQPGVSADAVRDILYRSPDQRFLDNTVYRQLYPLLMAEQNKEELAEIGKILAVFAASQPPDFKLNPVSAAVLRPSWNKPELKEASLALLARLFRDGPTAMPS